MNDEAGALATGAHAGRRGRYLLLSTLAMLLLGVLAGVVIRISLPLRASAALAGGTAVVYQISEASDDPDLPGAPSIGHALLRRIDPSGTSGARITWVDDHQVQVTLSAIDGPAIERMNRLISAGGVLEFLIVADELDHGDLWRIAGQAGQSDQNVRNRSGEVAGRWVPLSIDSAMPADQQPAYRVNPGSAKTKVLDGRRWILLVVNPKHVFDGTDLASVRRGFAGTNPCIYFTTTPSGARKLAVLTGSNLPDRAANHFSRLGIVLDDELISAPRINDLISDSGVIAGEFSEAEVDLIVQLLRAGRLPVKIDPTPVSIQAVPASAEAFESIQLTLGLGGGLAFVLWITLCARYGMVGAVAALAVVVQSLLATALYLLVGGIVGLIPLAAFSITLVILLF